MKVRRQSPHGRRASKPDNGSHPQRVMFAGVLVPTQSSFSVPALPHDRLLYGTLLTLVNGTWVFQVVGFTS